MKKPPVYNVKVYCTVPTLGGKYGHDNLGRNVYAHYIMKITTPVCRNNLRQTYRILRKDVSAFVARSLVTSLISHNYEWKNDK